MIEYFNIPSGASEQTPISKKLFAEKVPLSAAEKRLLREEVERINMRSLLQTRTIGLEAYMDEEYCYDQIIVAEVDIKNPAKASAIALMIQKAFPAPMFLIIHCQNSYCVNWCIKRINQADNSKRVIEEQQTTRFFSTNSEDPIVSQWLESLDIAKIVCATLKDLFDELSAKLLMLQTADESGVFIHADTHNIETYRAILERLASNREEQKKIKVEIKAETQFNARLKLSAKLKELQMQEKELKGRMNYA